MLRVSLLSLSVIWVVSCAQETTPTTTPSDATDPPVVITANEYSYSPATVSLATPGSIELRNAGGLAHTWTVLADEIESEAELSDAEILAEVRVQVGQSATTDISTLPSGTYQVVCAIPGHFSAGMEGQLVIGS